MGKVELINYVLHNFTNYWCNVFVNPKGIIKDIESKFAAFLWNNRNDNAKGAIGAWDEVCCPKNEGGLGI